MSKNDLPYSTQTWGYYKNVSGGKLPSVKSDWTTEWIRKLWRHLMCYMKICIHRKYNTLDNDPKPWLSQVISIRKDSVCLEPNIHPPHKSRVPFSTMYGTMQCYALKWHSRCLPVGRRWHGLAIPQHTCTVLCSWSELPWLKALAQTHREIEDLVDLT